MAHVLILGGSFAGLEAAHTLRRLAGDRVRITVIDRSPRFEFRPSLPWVITGQRRPEDTWVPRAPLLEKIGAEFVHDEVQHIDPGKNAVITRRGRFGYDFLLIALGGTSPPRRPAGLGGRGWAPLWLDDSVRLQQALERFAGGPVVIAFQPGSPLTCATYELVFQLDAFLRRRGLRGRSPLAFVSYEKRPYDIGGAKAGRIMQKWLDEANVRFFPGTFVQRAADRWVRLAGGASLRSDLLVYVPAYQGAPAVRAVPRLTDEDGFVVTDRTMRSPAYPNVFAAGDCVAFPGPKTGLMAEQQARVAAANIAAAVAAVDAAGGAAVGAAGGAAGGQRRPAEYSSLLGCMLDLGPGRGLLTWRRPAPRHGPARSHAVLPGVLPWLAKLAFEKYFMHVRLGKPLFRGAP
ncbi:MAG: FAD-dependent oxidoreductase [Limnochordales bacterium]|nr:MAG: hypothetical protein DIU83_09585 [Bacillota bacterium]